MAEITKHIWRTWKEKKRNNNVSQGLDLQEMCVCVCVHACVCMRVCVYICLHEKFFKEPQYRFICAPIFPLIWTLWYSVRRELNTTIIFGLLWGIHRNRNMIHFSWWHIFEDFVQMIKWAILDIYLAQINLTLLTS